MKTSIKICGIKSVEAIEAAGQLKVDAVGFVLYPPSPRAVSLQQLSELERILPAFVMRVGLLVNPEPDEVHQLIQSQCLDLIQFHGRESGQFCEQFGFPYLKALAAEPGMNEPSYWQTQLQEYPSARAFLMDTPDPRLHGGTGKTFDWSWWPKPKICVKPLILAGGLNSKNVAQAIGKTQPYAVDVSGGVERARGEKCVASMQEFVDTVRLTDYDK